MKNYLIILLCLFVSLIIHFWLIHFFHLHLLYQPYVGLCQATCVQSHQRQPRSAVAIATSEVQVSAADSQTVPTVATEVSKPLCCRLTLTFTLTSEKLSSDTTLLLYWSLYNYAAHAADASLRLIRRILMYLWHKGSSDAFDRYNAQRHSGRNWNKGSETV